ncbi:MAG: glycosyltransferase family 4 protein [Candidatus Aminicenantes bacterium]|nr:glycosyltransferase family 4 protein [Candidatus Aminicenantes bacterium]
MNILTCAGVLDKISGYNLTPRRLSVEFKRLGHSILCLCHRKPADFLPEENSADFLVLEAKDYFAPGSLFGAIARFHPDVIFTHNMAPTDRAGVRYAKKHRLPVFSMVHTRYRHFLLNSVPLKPLRIPAAAKYCEDRIIRFLSASTLVFAPTEDMKSYLQEVGLSRVAVAGFGADLDLFVPGPDAPPENGVVRILFVGQIREMKNQIYLLKMSQFLPDGYHLDIVGGKTWDVFYFRRFLKEIRSRRYPKVEWHGELRPQEIGRLFARAHVFVNPSLLDAQCLAQIEALVTGLPTVRLCSERTRGVTAHLKTAMHLDERTPPREFASAVVELMRNERLYRDLRRGALAERETYSWRNCAQRVLSYFAARGATALPSAEPAGITRGS